MFQIALLLIVVAGVSMRSGAGTVAANKAPNIARDDGEGMQAVPFRVTLGFERFRLPNGEHVGLLCANNVVELAPGWWFGPVGLLNARLELGRRPESAGGATRYASFLTDSGNGSFPSGHVTHAFSVASAIAAHYGPLWIKAIAYGVASLMGWSRVYHDAYFASDVLPGATIGSLVRTSLIPFHGFGSCMFRWCPFSM